MRRLLAAAALCAAASCQPAKQAPPRAAAPKVVPPAPAVPPPPPPPDPAQVSRDSLEAARARRLAIAQAEQRPEPDTAAIAAEAQSCAADARRSWMAQLPEAAQRDRMQARERVGAAGAEALYLEAVCAATAARMQGFTPLIERQAELAASLRRVAQLAPDLDGAGAERELGALRAALPTYAGGDLDEARDHLLAAVRRAPQDPRNHLVLARTVAVKAQDRALFREHLEMVLGLGDGAASAQAEALLQREDELFGPKGEAAQPIPGGPQR